MNSQPLVSVIIPTKNRADLLPRAIDSVLAQSYEFIQLIIVDDGSTDNTADIIKNYQKENELVYLRNEESVGLSAARNIGFTIANGDFVTWVDDDDEWLPNRISILLDQYDDSFAAITSNDRIISGDQTIVWNKKPIITQQDLLYSNCVGNQALIKKKKIDVVGGFDESLLAAVDLDLWIRLTEKFGPIKNVTIPLQNLYQEKSRDRITTSNSRFIGYFDVYKKHKRKMTRNQRKYQLFNIRLAQGKVSSAFELMGWVPRERLWKEMKRWLADRVLSF